MNRALRKEDAQIVDLLLDGRVGAKDAPQFVSRGMDPNRVATIDKLLHAIGQMPEPEVPGDLVSRTLQFIENSAVGVERNIAAPLPVQASRPHA